MPVTPADDQRHEPVAGVADWSESWSFSFIDPFQRLFGVARLDLLPNKDSCCVYVAVSWLGRLVYHRQLVGLPLPAGDVLSGIDAGGLSLRALSLPRGRFLVSFVDPQTRFAFDLDWHGLHEAADAIAMQGISSEGPLSGIHIEQMGGISGRLSLSGHDFALSGAGSREHAVGTRSWSSLGWYDCAMLTLDDGRALGLRQVQRGAGVAQLSWIWDGHKLASLSSMRFEKSLDSEGRPASVTIHVVDALGARHLLNGTRRTSLPSYHDGYVAHAGHFDFVLDNGARGVGCQHSGYRMTELA